MKKEQRHQLIVEILEQEMIHTQEELLQQLKLRGITATQATISRDLNDLKVIKATTENGEKQLKLFTVDEMKHKKTICIFISWLKRWLLKWIEFSL